MKPTLDLKAEMLPNEHLFTDPFFQRFALRHAPTPLALSETVSKDYLFPTLYADVTCAIGIFHCDYDAAKAMLPHPKMRPVRMTLGRSLVAFSCYEYKNVLNIGPYNEIAMTIPVLFDPKIDVPVAPMVVSGFPGFGYYVFSMPVTSKENQLRGNKLWGLPKVTEEIDVFEERGDCVTVAKDDAGAEYFRLRVPMSGKPARFDVSTVLYSELDGKLLKSPTNFRGTFNVTKHMGLLARKNAKPDRTYLTIGQGKGSETLRNLKLEEHPFQFRYIRGLTSAFDLPDPEFSADKGAK